MTKALIQFILLAATFFLMWFLLSKINFTGTMDLDNLSEKNEKKIGELLMDVILKKNDKVRNDSINFVVKSITNRICEKNKIDIKKIKIHVIDNSDVNALTLPDRHLVVYTGLIKYCKTPEELAGVIAHEIAHMEKDHVMKKLIKEVGLSMLFVIAGGNGSFEILGEVLRTLSSKAFDRDQETEADLHAVKLLSTAEINPHGLSDFLFRLSQESADMPDEFVLISTHPGSGERASEIIAESKKYKNKITPLNMDDWEQIRNYTSE